MSAGINLIMNDDGVFKEYDDTYDITIHCETEKEYNEVLRRLPLDPDFIAINEYNRGWHDALRKALQEKYSIHTENGNFEVVQVETLIGLGVSRNCAIGEPYQPKGEENDT